MTRSLVRSELVDAIVRLHDHTPAPFDLFITETLRAMEFPVREDPPANEVADAVRAVTHVYWAAVADEEPFFDILGPVFSEVSSHGRRQQSGQFFTPWDLSVLCVEMTLGGWEPRINPDSEDGLWGVYEPACGAGAMLLAFLHTIHKRHGPDALLLWRALAQDVDRTVARTCALQVLSTLTRNGWGLGEIRIEHGDTLRMQTFEVVLSGEAKRRHPALDELRATAAAVEVVRRAVDAVASDGRPPRADDRGQYLLLPPSDAEAA